LLGPNESEVSFVDKFGGLQRWARVLQTHKTVSQPVELFINYGDELPESLLISMTPGFE
jgi:hypothetical protein